MTALKPHLALLVSVCVSAGAEAQTTRQLTRPAQAGAPLQRAAPSKDLLTVMLKFADEPVAVVRSRAPQKQLSEWERQSIAADLRAKQDAMRPLIEARGGTIRRQMQHAVNGITVTVPADKLSALATIPGVIAVKPVQTWHLTNAESVPFIGADATWAGAPGFRGEGEKIFVLDTGIDYTHANFGGPGTKAAFAAAFANSTAPADPSLFGPGAAKVKGGTDLVGDAYNANDPTSVPEPDPNPLDCNGHGSHTAGTAAGFGVDASGATYHGPYDNSTPAHSFIIGPGVAPLADIYSVRVFGCAGSTNVVTEAIDYAVANGADVISMSLGSDFGTADSSDAEASQNAQDAGVIVVAAAGNAGNIPYIVSSPGVGNKTVSVAAVDSHAGFPGATVALSTGSTIAAIDADGISFANGTTLPIVVLRTSTGAISLGCNPAEYVAANVAGKIAVVKRGTCARVARAIYGQQAGAAAVLMVNNANGFPPYEGPITSNPDTGIPYNVTIPFLGTSLANQATVLAADGGSATLSAAAIANPTFRQFASFSSSGVREGDAHLKPDVSAPGVSVFSTASGSGTGGLFESGTSMATPHVAGSAALALQSHPSWDPDDVRKALVNSSDPSQVSGYTPRRGGAGLVQPYSATRTSVIAVSGDQDEPNVSFGVAEFDRDFSGSRTITLRNLGNSNVTFHAAATAVTTGSPQTVTVSPSTVSVRAGRSANVTVTLKVAAATAGDSSAYREVGGIVTFSPSTATGNNGVSLTVPYYLVPRARSLVSTAVPEELNARNPVGTARVRNSSRSVAGSADFYAWSLSGKDNGSGEASIRAVGAQSFDGGPGLGQVIVFAVNTYQPWFNPSMTVFDIYIDVNGDGVPDYDIEVADLGLLTTGAISGQMVSAVFDLNNGGGFLEFLATAPTNGTTVLIPIVASDAGITAANPRFTYVAAVGQSFLTGLTDVVSGPAGFNAFANALSTGGFAAVAPGGSASVPLSIDPAEWKITPALGAMIVSIDNSNGGEDSQAQLSHVRLDN